MRVQDLANPVNYLEGLAWTCVGGAISAVLGLVVWYPTNAQLSDKLQTQFAWVAIAIWIFLAAVSAVAVHSFIVTHLVHKRMTRDAARVVGEMDAIHEPHVTTSP
jgi:hypothetical protein